MATEETFLIGTGQTYTTLAGYISGEAQDLVAADINQVVTLDSTAFGEDFQSAFVGFTTDATRNIKITVADANRPDGTVDGSTIHLTNTNSSQMFRPVSTCDWLVLDGLYLEVTASSCIGDGNSCENTQVIRCMLLSSTGGDDLISTGTAINVESTAFVMHSGNDFCVCTAGVNGIFNNCTGIGQGDGRGFVGNAVYTNCIALQANSTGIDQENAASDYNLTDDASITGGNNFPSETASDIVTDLTSGSEDFNLKASTNAIQTGTDMGVALDMLGNSLSTTPDLGCIQFTAAAATFNGHLLLLGAG